MKELLKLSNEESNKKAREILCATLLNLMKEKPFKDITITEISNKSKVSRTAFYNNYKSKNDLLRDYVLILNEEILNIIGSPFEKEQSLDLYIRLFTEIYNRSEEIKLIFDSGFQEEYLKISNDIILFDDPYVTWKKQSYMALIWNGGFQNLMLYWLRNGMKESIEEMALICFEFFKK